MRRVAGVAAALAFGGLVPAASATPAPDGTAFVNPATAGAGSHLKIDAKGQDGGLTPKDVPTAMTLAVQKGFTFDPAAVASTCTADQAKNYACPADSTVANGSFIGVVTGPGFGPNGHPFDAAVTFFKAPPQQSGDPAGIVFSFKESSSGFQGESIGRLMDLPSDPVYGSQIRFDKLPLPSLPPGITITINELKLDLGAGTAAPAHTPAVQRKKKHHKKKRLPPCSRHRHKHCRDTRKKHARAHAAATGAFLTNPATCTGNWTVALEMDYASHQERREATVPCSASR